MVEHLVEVGKVGQHHRNNEGRDRERRRAQQQRPPTAVRSEVDVSDSSLKGDGRIEPRVARTIC
eukprot:7116740-Pyramimonas_sp.AAC.1